MLKTDAAQTRPPSLTLSAGHRGATATGDRTLGVNIGLDNPLGLADRWGLSLKRSGEGRVIPDDGHPLSRSLTFSGNSKSLMLSVKRAIHRDQVLKTAVALRAKRKDAVNELLGTVIDVNSPILDTAELKLTRNRPVRDGNLDLSLSWRQGLGARESVLSSQSGGKLTNTPYLRLAIDRMPLTEASANCGFHVGHVTGAGVEKLTAGDVNGAAADFAAAYDAGNAEGSFYSERLCEPGLGTDRDEMRAA
jgi:hemolysin activation/secretion protein